MHTFFHAPLTSPSLYTLSGPHPRSCEKPTPASLRLDLLRLAPTPTSVSLRLHLCLIFSSPRAVLRPRLQKTQKNDNAPRSWKNTFAFPLSLSTFLPPRNQFKQRKQLS